LIERAGARRVAEVIGAVEVEVASSHWPCKRSLRRFGSREFGCHGRPASPPVLCGVNR
jgi:hypothetical protein